MALKPASAKAKGSRLERDAAKVLGGVRMVLSGAIGGGDIDLRSVEPIFKDFTYECKARAALPAYINSAFLQAEVEARGSNKKPAVIFRENRGRMFIMLELEDFAQWGRALAETGQSWAIRDLARQAQRLLKQIEEATK